MSKSDRFTRESKKIAKENAVPLSVAKRIHSAELKALSPVSGPASWDVSPRIRSAANPCRPVAWSAGIGVDGGVEIVDMGVDLNRSPHLAIIGVVGSGKTMALSVMLDQLEKKIVPPEVWSFSAERSMSASENGHDHFGEFVEQVQAELQARIGDDSAAERSALVVVIDGIEDCISQESARSALPALVDVARLGRAVNIHLVVTIQRLASVGRNAYTHTDECSEVQDSGSGLDALKELIHNSLKVVCGRISPFDRAILGIGDDVELREHVNHVCTGGQWVEVRPFVTS